jgi:hypothetical protein
LPSAWRISKALGFGIVDSRVVRVRVRLRDKLCRAVRVRVRVQGKPRLISNYDKEITSQKETKTEKERRRQREMKTKMDKDKDKSKTRRNRYTE